MCADCQEGLSAAPPLPPAYRLSVAIATFGREQYLVDTIESVLEYLEADMELIVIDQTEAHLEPVQSRLDAWSRDGRIRYERMRPPSLTRARNVALQMARAPIVLFLDDDVIVCPGLLRGHLSQFDDAKVGAAAGQEYHYRLSSERPSFDDRAIQSLPTFLPRSQAAGPVVKFGGANHSIRRDLAIRLGGYDESFVGSAFGEDYEMSARVRAAGMEIRYDPRLEVIHRLAPVGGCRTPGNKLLAEWSKTASYFLLLFRFGWRPHSFWQIAVWRTLRAGPMRRENLVNPLRWPGAWLGLLRGLIYSWRRRNRITSIFVSGCAVGSNDHVLTQGTDQAASTGGS